MDQPHSPSAPSSPNSPGGLITKIQSPNSPAEGESNNPEIFYPCSYPDCDYKSNWKENVGRHEKRHNSSGILDFYCHICPRNYRSLVSFLHHMSSQHSSHQLSCPSCSFITQEFSEFKAHMLAHSMTQSFFNGRSNSNHDSNNKPVAKVQAQKSSAQKRSQIKHKTPSNSASSKVKVERSILQHALTEEPTFTCAACSRSFTLKCNLLRHQRKSCIARSIKRSTPKVQVKVEVIEPTESSGLVLLHKCLHCSDRFATRSLMFRHIKSHRKPEPKTDGPNRDQKFKPNRDQTNELNRDQTNGPDQDQMNGSNRDEMSQLNRDATDSPNREQNEWNRDGASGPNRDQMNESTRKQPEESRCPYPDCGYTTSRPATLQTHIKVRHEFVPKFEPTDAEDQGYRDMDKFEEQRALYSCDKCSYKTSFVHNMRMHARIHSGEKPFKCRTPGCDYKARWAQNLRVHQQRCEGPKVKSVQRIVPKILKKPRRVNPAKKAVNFKQIESKIQAATQIFGQFKPKIEVFENDFGGKVQMETAQPIVPENTEPAVPKIAQVVAQESDQVPTVAVQTNSQRPSEMIKKVVVRGETLFKCAICGYKSKWKPNLKSHLMVHTDHKPYACPIGDCEYRSKWSQSVRQHARIVHRVDLPRKMNLEFKENLGSDYLALISPLAIKSEREHSQQNSPMNMRRVQRNHLQHPSKIATNLTAKNFGPIQNSAPKYCLFCDYASKLSKYLRKHLRKCSSCNVIQSDGAQDLKEREIHADLNSDNRSERVSHKVESTNDNAGE